MDIGQSVMATLALEGDLRMINAQEVQNGGVQIVNMHRIPNHVATQGSFEFEGNSTNLAGYEKHIRPIGA